MSLPKTNSVVLPGKILTEYAIPSYRIAEQHFEGALLESAGRAASKLKSPVANAIVQAAMAEIAAGKLCWGTPGFYMRVVSGTYLAFLLWLAMTPAQPATKLEDATALIDRDNQGPLVDAIMELMGYAVPNAGKGEENSNPPPNPEAKTE